MTAPQRSRALPPRFRPPFLALALVLVAWLLDWRLDPPRIVSWPWAWLGAALIALALALITWALRLFHGRDTTHDPRGRPSRMVTEGPYRFTRNPMYVGLTAILAGIGLLVGTWPFVAVPPIAFVVLVSSFYIRREERIMESVFGAEYVEFRRRVRRWL